MRIALAQINTTVGDFTGNLARIRAALERTRDSGVDLVVFPEQTLPGYPAEDLLERADFLRQTQAAFDEVVALTSDYDVGVVVGTLSPSGKTAGKPVHNSVALIEKGKILGVQHKSLLPTYDVFDEGRYFEPAAEHPVFDFRGRRVALAICEDVWNDPAFWSTRLYPVDPVQEWTKKGAELLIVVSASPFSIGRLAFRQEMLTSLVRRWKLPLVYTNLVGGNTTLVFDGNSLALDARGRLLARSAAFQEDWTVVDVEGPEIASPGFPDAAEEARAALVLGTRDYLRKSGFERAVLGLSGGIDSSLTAVIAAEALGAENVIGVSMPSRYSSEGSKTDAQLLARNLGLQLHEAPIEGIFSASLQTLAPIFAGRAPDVAEENLQARARGLILMAISNKFGALLLTTGNKSELAVGYCTLYGDMSGGLAVISDVPKTLVYEICRHINRDTEIIPETVLDKPPSAELRPDQTDQDSLPPYDVLDAVLEAYIERGAAPDEIVALGHPREMVVDILKKVDRNEYKRKQAAPGLRVTTKAFGPGRRFPIVGRFRGGD